MKTTRTATERNPVLTVFKKRLSLIRWRPFDCATAEGRSQERARRIALAALAAGVAKAVSLLTLLVSVPLTLKYLGPERYGLWMTISSFQALLVFADMGLGNGLLNAVADAHGSDDVVKAREHIASAFYMLLAVATALGLLFAFVYPVIPWGRIFNVTSARAVAESGPAVTAFAVCFLLGIPLGIAQRVQMGYQDGFYASLWQAAGSLIGFAALVVAVTLRAGLPWLVLGVLGGPLIANLINGVVLFWRQRPILMPRRKNATLASVRRLLSSGALFFVLQVAVALAFSSDNIVTAQVLGSEAVTQYSVPMRLFGIAPAIMMLVLTPLWPAYGEAQARRDFAWIRSTLVRSLLTTGLVVGLPSLILVFAGPTVLHAWAGPAIMPSTFLLVGMAFWASTSAVGNALAMFLNGLGAIRLQASLGLAMVVPAIAAKIALARLCGLPGVVWGTLLTYLIIVIVPLTVYSYRLVKRLAMQSYPGYQV